jgi:uncharacterized membrane protein YdbT with pleckstrin-like domain
LVVRRHPLTLCAVVTVRLLAVVSVPVVAEMAGVGNPGVVAVGALAAAAWCLIRWARWRADTLTLYGSDLMLRSGLVARSCRVIPTDAVQDVTTERSLVGWLLGYGVLVIRLRAGAPLRLTAVPDPEALRDRIMAARLDAAGRW